MFNGEYDGIAEEIKVFLLGSYWRLLLRVLWLLRLV